MASGTQKAIGSARHAFDSGIRQGRSTTRQAVVITASRKEAGLLEIALGEGATRDPHPVHVVSLADEARTEIVAGEDTERTPRHASIIETWRTVETWDGSPAVMIASAASNRNHTILVQAAE